MRLQRRGLLIMGAAAAAAVGLSACGRRTSPQPTATNTAGAQTWQNAVSQGGGQLSFLSALYADKKQQDSFNSDVVNPFFANTSYSMNPSWIEWDRFPDKIVTLLANGKLPDIVMGATGWVPALQRNNALIAMPDDITNDLGLNEHLMAGCRWNNTLYALPYATDLTMIGYRPDLWAKAGVTAPPTTLDELRDTAKKLTNADTVGFDIFGPGIAHSWAMLVHCFGGKLFTDDGKVAFTDGSGSQALNWIIDLVKDGSADPDKTPAAGQPRAFVQSKAAMEPLPTSVWPALQSAHLDDEQHSAFFPMPSSVRSKPAVMLQTGTQLAVTRTASSPQVAFQLCHHLLQANPLVKALTMVPAVSPRTDAVANTDLANNRMIATGIANVQYATATLGGTPAWFDVQPVIEGQLMAAIKGQQSADATIGNLTQVVTNSMGRPA